VQLPLGPGLIGQVCPRLVPVGATRRTFKIEVFVVRVGEWGGHLLVDCNDPLEVHKFCSTYPALEFQARAGVPVQDAVRVELEAMSWHAGLDGKRRPRDVAQVDARTGSKSLQASNGRKKQTMQAQTDTRH
jgi:hypothetical protein